MELTDPVLDASDGHTKMLLAVEYWKKQYSALKARYDSQRELTTVGITQQVKLLKRIEEINIDIIRLRAIEMAAVACCEHPVWNDDQFYWLMTKLQRELRGEVSAGETAVQGDMLS